MEKVMWHSAISYAGQGIGKPRVYQVFKAPLETGCQGLIDNNFVYSFLFLKCMLGSFQFHYYSFLFF